MRIRPWRWRTGSRAGAGAHRDDAARRPVSPAGRPALSRLRGGLWPVLQQTAAATISWWVASHVVDHHLPIFAPITTLIALNANRGERGTNAVRFVLGVFAGIIVAEVAVLTMGAGYGTFALAVLVAMVVALAIGGERITVAQAAVSAILVVATSGSAQSGTDRLVDVCLGAAVALVFSQLLFPVEPIALLRRAESAALTHLGDALHLTARALRRRDDHLGDWTWAHLRAVYTQLADLSRARDSTARAARHSPVWWGRSPLVAHEGEYATRLDLLGNSCLMLTRTAEDLAAAQRAELAPLVQDLAGTVEALAIAPGDPVVRQYAAERAARVAGRLPEGGNGSHELTAAYATVRTVIEDVLLFVGTEAEQARRIVDGRTDEPPETVAPPTMPRTPFHGRRLRPPWRDG